MDVCKWGHYLFVPDTTSLAWERQLGKKKKKKKKSALNHVYICKYIYGYISHCFPVIIKNHWDVFVEPRMK